jgi:hypothetical protein
MRVGLRHGAEHLSASSRLDIADPDLQAPLIVLAAPDRVASKVSVIISAGVAGLAVAEIGRSSASLKV